MSEPNTINKAVNDLFNYAEKILTYKSSSLNPNPIVVKMKKFQKIVDMMEDYEKIELFRDKLYNVHKDAILKYSSEKNFLAQPKITVSIGNSGDRVLMLSSIYAKTLKLKDDAEKMLEGLPESAKDKAMEDAEELNFPDIVSLYTFRILKLGAENDTEKAKLSKIVTDIESELGITSATSPTANNGTSIGTALSATGINPASFANLGGANGLSGLLANLGPTIQNLQKQFSGTDGKQADFASVMNNLVNANPTIKGVINSAFPDSNKWANASDALTSVTDKIGDPNLKNVVEGFSQKLPDIINMLSPTNAPTAEQTAVITGANSTASPTLQD